MIKKLLPYFVALAAIAVSTSAAFYSITGLMKLFAGASTAVGIMATSLEFSKVIVVSVLYQYWKSLNVLLKSYLVVASIILMVITSIGIYGFLSSAYQQTANKSKISTFKLESLESKLLLYKQEEKSLLEEKQMLFNVKGSLSKATTTQYLDKKGNLIVTSNRYINKELSRATDENNTLNRRYQSLQDSILKIQGEILSVKQVANTSSELGPLTYLAQVTKLPMEKVINYLLLIIVFVFDPLAISLVLATNFAFKQTKRSEKQEEDAVEQLPTQGETPLPDKNNRPEKEKEENRLVEQERELITKMDTIRNSADFSAKRQQQLIAKLQEELKQTRQKQEETKLTY